MHDVAKALHRCRVSIYAWLSSIELPLVKLVARLLWLSESPVSYSFYVINFSAHTSINRLELQLISLSKMYSAADQVLYGRGT